VEAAGISIAQLNCPRFNMSVVFIANYFLVEVDVFVNNESLLMIDFVNLKIKSAQSFRGGHRDMMCARVFI
jgi:hypothetical protein